MHTRTALTVSARNNYIFSRDICCDLVNLKRENRLKAALTTTSGALRSGDSSISSDIR